MHIYQHNRLISKCEISVTSISQYFYHFQYVLVGMVQVSMYRSCLIHNIAVYHMLKGKTLVKWVEERADQCMSGNTGAIQLIFKILLHFDNLFL